MKNTIEQFLFFSFPERKALSYFFTILGILITSHYLFNSLFPPKLPDNSMYEELFIDIRKPQQEETSKVQFLKRSNSSLGEKNNVNNAPIKKAKRVLVKKEENKQHQQFNSSPKYPIESNPMVSKTQDSIIIDHKKNIIKVDINTSEEYEFQYLKGIGPSYASRIVKYRNMLGGFNSLDQLKEVYGMDEVLFKQIEPFLFISGSVKKLPVDQPDPPFFRHPYLTYQQAKIIRAYILQHGPLQKPEDLLKIKIVNQETVDKIKPYLPF